MSANTPPMKYALLVAALLQVIPASAYAAKDDKDVANDAQVCEDCPEPGERSAWIEGGIGLQSNDSYYFGRYTGRESNGASISLDGAFKYRDKLNTGAYVDGKFVDVGLDSRLLAVEGGRQGKYAIAVEYDELPNYRKSLTNASLETKRDQLGVRFSIIPGATWEVSGHYRHENKEGTRDTGSSFGYSSPQILAVPVDYQTDDFGVAVGYRGERMQARLAYEASLFKNGNDDISWVNPALIPAQGKIAESPDNQFHQLSAQLAFQVSDKTQLNGSFARGRMTQDQQFLPYGTVPSPALPTNNLDGQVNTTLAKLDINTRLSPRVLLDASYTHSDRDNQTPINSYSYILGENLAIPTGDRQNLPFSFEQNLLRLKAGYRFANGADLSGGFDNDKIQRTYQQAEETEDKTLWAKLRLQPMESVETTFKLSHADRDASTYDPTAYQNPRFPNSGAVAGEPLMKPFHLADRTRDKVGVDVSYAAKENLNVAINVDYYKDEYQNMVLGLNDAKGVSLTPSFTYAFNDKGTLSGYFAYESLKSEQNGREWYGPNLNGPDTGFGPGIWLSADANVTRTVGMNIDWKLITKKLDVGAEVVFSDFSGKVEYPGSLDLPELKSTLAAIGVHGVYKLKDNTSIRAGYRYEKYREDDWANVNFGAVPGLGVAPETQKTHLIYIAVRYAFK